MLASRASGCNERRCAAEEARLPGPGLELIGEEEIAEVVGVLRSGFLSRHGPNDPPAVGARPRPFGPEVAREAGPRPSQGRNLRVPQLEGAGLMAQLGKLDAIRAHLQANKRIVESVLTGLPGLAFRVLPDPDGDLATHFVTIFPSGEIARRVAGELGA